MTDIAHFNMVEQQVRTWNVHSARLLEAMMTLDRRFFVPEDQQALCFFDTRITVDDHCRMLAPRVVARLVQALEIDPEEHVLVLGAGSGYSVALCAMMAKTVVCHDTSQAALDRAAANCEKAGITNIGFQKVNAMDCSGDSVQYNGILMREGCVEVPSKCMDHLADRGRCVALVGQDNLMELMRYTRTEEGLDALSVVDVLMLNNDALADSVQVKQAFVF